MLLYLVSGLVPDVCFVASLCCPAAPLPLESGTTDIHQALQMWQVGAHQEIHFLKLLCFAMSLTYTATDNFIGTPFELWLSEHISYFKELSTETLKLLDAKSWFLWEESFLTSTNLVVGK